jgi:hypothetical protein
MFGLIPGEHIIDELPVEASAIGPIRRARVPDPMPLQFLRNRVLARLGLGIVVVASSQEEERGPQQEHPGAVFPDRHLVSLFAIENSRFVQRTALSRVA